MIYGIAAMISLACGIFILCPFWLGPGGTLAASAALNHMETIKHLKVALVRRFILEEQAHTQGLMSKRAWQARSRYLTHRYVDLARRLDYLSYHQHHTPAHKD